MFDDDDVVDKISLVCYYFNKKGSCSCKRAAADVVAFMSLAAAAAIDDVDDVRLYVFDELPIFTRVWSLLFRFEEINIEDLCDDGISQITNMADKASMEPNRNGGPGSKCFKQKKKLNKNIFIKYCPGTFDIDK